MIPTATLFLLGVDADVRRALEGLIAPDGCAIENHATARTFLDSYDPSRAGCIVLDIAVADSDGCELQQKLSAGHPVPPVIILAGDGPLPPIPRGFTLAPVDFLRKPVDLSELRRAVTSAVARDQETRCRLSLIAELHGRAALLTDQERDVMALMVQGLAQKHIAARLKIGMRTVQLRRSCVMRKMRVSSLAELVQFSIILGRPTGLATEAAAPQAASA